MLAEFLAYRYAGLRRPDQILLDREGVGWKCRKYIRWRQVHNKPDDGKVLKDFADDLFDREKVNLSLYGRVNLILLNVQKWRLDKEKLSGEPPPNEAWEYLNTLLQVIAHSPQVMAQWLSDRSAKLPDSSIDIQHAFYVRALNEFFSKQDLPFYAPLGEGDIVPGNDAKFAQVIRKHFKPIYKAVGVDFPDDLQSAALLKRIYKDFGFGIINVRSALKLEPLPETVTRNQVFLEYKALEVTKLFKISSVQGNILLQLNSGNPFIVEMAKLENAKALMEMFFRSYAKSVLVMSGAEDTISTFGGYLEAYLSRELMSKKKL
jgi:hypothetical protein